MLQDKLGLVCQRHTEITGYTIGAQTRTKPRSTNNFAYLTGRNFGLAGWRTMYAAVFVLVNITYLALCWEAVDRPTHEDVTQRMRRLLRMRSFITIVVFAAAAVVALWWPLVGMVLICLCLIGYLRPDIPEVKEVGRLVVCPAINWL